jgi:hypothetical protein
MDAVVATIIRFHQGGTPMNRRTKYAVGIVIAVFSLSLPNLLLAQDGLTLESLAERIEILFRGQNDLHDRLAAVETQIAPTPTRTLRPTATPRIAATATAQAKATAQSRFRSRATATAIARSRATATTRPTSTPEPKAGWAELAYSQEIGAIAHEFGTNLTEMGDLFNDPKFADENWQNLVFTHSLLIQLAYDAALGISPPTSMRDVHEEFMRGAKECEQGATLIVRGVANFDSSSLENAMIHILNCNTHMQNATQLMESKYPELRNQ